MEVALATNKTLTKLDVRNNSALWQLKESGEEESEGLDALGRGLHASVAIQHVHVDEMHIQVQPLKGSEPVRELEYAACKQLTDISAALLCSLVALNPAAVKLDLSRIKTAPRLGHAVGRCLKANKALVEVLLRESELGDAGVSALADGLRANTASQVRVLDLASNSIGAAGAEKLSAVLNDAGSGRCSIAKLDLSSNQLGSAGTQALMPSIKSNRSVTALSLRDNDIDGAGASAIAACLLKNEAVSTLWLGKNKMNNEGVISVIDALTEAKASKIANLDLHKNNVSKPAMASITKLLAESSTLMCLGLAGAKLQFIETEALQQAAQPKPELGRAKAVRLWMGNDMNKWPDL